MGQVIHLQDPQTSAAAWDRYVALLDELKADDRLRRDIDFNMRLARTWAHWRDLFLAEGR